MEFLWYIPNQATPGHRGDDVVDGPQQPATADRPRRPEEHGWGGALLGTGWGRPDTFTVATALAARTTTFRPLIAIRPGYWRPAHFASAAATLDHLTGGRVLVNIVSGKDNLAAYGDSEGDQAHRYGRTREFLQLVRRLWTEENVTFHGEHFRRRPAPPSSRPVPARPPAPAALLRRRVRGRRAGRRHRGRRPALLGRAARRRRERIERLQSSARSWAATRPAGVRAADHHAGARHHRAGLGRRRGQGRRDGRGPHEWAADPAGAASASSGCSTWPRAATCSTTTSTPPPASSAAAARAPPGWSARPRTWRSRCADTPTSASPTSCSPTPRTSRRSSAWATPSCRSCARPEELASAVRGDRRTRATLHCWFVESFTLL